MYKDYKYREQKSNDISLNLVSFSAYSTLSRCWARSVLTRTCARGDLVFMRIVTGIQMHMSFRDGSKFSNDSAKREMKRMIMNQYKDKAPRRYSRRTNIASEGLVRTSMLKSPALIQTDLCISLIFDFFQAQVSARLVIS